MVGYENVNTSSSTVKRDQDMSISLHAMNILSLVCLLKFVDHGILKDSKHRFELVLPLAPLLGSITPCKDSQIGKDTSLLFRILDKTEDCWVGRVF
jgi:hypothetical protein